MNHIPSFSTGNVQEFPTEKQKLSTHLGQMQKPMCEAKNAGTDEPAILGIWVRSEGILLKSLVQEKHNCRIQTHYSSIKPVINLTLRPASAIRLSGNGSR